MQVVRWKSRKLIKQLDREMAWQFKIPTGLDIERHKGDTVPVKISLDGFVTGTKNIDFEKRWLAFLGRSSQRTKLYQSRELSPYEKVFNKGDSDADGLGLDEDDWV